MANFIYIRQKGPYGNGTPILTAEPAIEDEPFAVLWGDEFIYSKPPRLSQMIKVHEKYGGIVISGVRIDKKEDLRRYGIADVTPVEGNVYKINAIIEKPEPEKAPSNLATHGGYILPPEIFDALREVKPGKDGEIWLVDAINLLKSKGVPLYAVEIENAKYYDTGNKIEYMKTVVEFGLQLVEHCLAQVDAGYVEPGQGERQQDSASAAGQFQHRPAGLLGHGQVERHVVLLVGPEQVIVDRVGVVFRHGSPHEQQAIGPIGRIGPIVLHEVHACGQRADVVRAGLEALDDTTGSVQQQGSGIRRRGSGQEEHAADDGRRKL